MHEFLDKRYAIALYAVAAKNHREDEVLQQFKYVVDEVYNNEGLMKIVKHPQISKAAKKRIFIEIFAMNVSEELLNFILLLVEKDRILFLKEKYEQYRIIHLQKKDCLIAVVTTVIPLNDEEIETIKEKLSKKYNKQIVIDEVIDEDIIGGIIIQVDNSVMDGSVRTRLNEMKNRLKES